MNWLSYIFFNDVSYPLSEANSFSNIEGNDVSLMNVVRKSGSKSLDGDVMIDGYVNDDIIKNHHARDGVVKFFNSNVGVIASATKSGNVDGMKIKICIDEKILNDCLDLSKNDKNLMNSTNSLSDLTINEKIDDINASRKRTSNEEVENKNNFQIESKKSKGDGYSVGSSSLSDPASSLKNHEYYSNEIKSNEDLSKNQKQCLSLGASTHIGGKSTNQDISFCIGLKTGYDSSIAVFDGHGKYGRQISRKVHDFFIKKIVEFISSQEKSDKLYPESENLYVHEFLKINFAEIEKIICNDIKHASKSGTTATVAIQRNSKLYIASTGDSRAVMGSSTWNCSSNNYLLTSRRLTTDHRFDNESEYKMIIKAGGEIRPRDGKNDGTLRVWVSEKKSLELGLRSSAPGLMVSRSIGDYLAKVAGCSAIPEIVSFDIAPENKFLIIASDGLWDIMDDEEAVNIVNSFNHSHDNSWAKISAERLIDIALEKCKQKRFSPDNITVAIMDLEKMTS